MNPRPPNSLPPEYFEQKYAEKLDYWDFEKSQYEASKYEHTLQALPRARYDSAFEIGCSVGVLTARLAERCTRLLSIDVSTQALAAAQARCPQARLRPMRFPQERPEGERFDLIVVSEVGYYWSRADLTSAQQAIEELLTAGGDLILVHWTPAETDYPLTGDEVHESFCRRQGLWHLSGERREKYRLDVFRRAANEPGMTGGV